MSTDHHVWLVAFPGVQALDLTGPHEVLAAANSLADVLGVAGTRYRLRLVGPEATVITESGLRLAADPLPDHDEPAPTTLLVPGGDGTRSAGVRETVVPWLAFHGARTDRLATVCTGALLAAEAGLLEGRRVTTHWAWATMLAERHPEVTVEPDAIHVHDGRVWTSAGVTAGIDLALALVEHDLGSAVAQEVARWFVVFLRRPGGQSQFAPTIWAERSGEGPIRVAQELVDRDPGSVGSVADLAAAVGLSPRHFTRRFHAEVGETPARYLERVRMSAARHRLETDDAGVAAVARACGFGTAETLRRVFHRHLGVSPDDYRKRFQTQET